MVVAFQHYYDKEAILNRFQLIKIVKFSILLLTSIMLRLFNLNNSSEQIYLSYLPYLSCDIVMINDDVLVNNNDVVMII